MLRAPPSTLTPPTLTPADADIDMHLHDADAADITVAVLSTLTFDTQSRPSIDPCPDAFLVV